MLITFDQLSSIYDFLMYPIERKILQKWREHLWNEIKGSRILEVGAGTGVNFRFYPDDKFIVAVDISPNMLHKARSKGKYNLVVGDVLSLPFGDDSFDAVVSTLVFCSVKDPLRGLDEIKRILRKGGFLYMLEHVRPRGWKGRVFDMLNPLSVWIMEEHINRNTHEIVKAAGFRILEIKDITSDGLFKYLVARYIG